MSLNYYAINKIIGGKMVAGDRARFGNFRLLKETGEVLRKRPTRTPQVRFSPADDKAIAQAFEEVRAGTAPDRILWDPTLAKKFHRRCRHLGIHAPSAILGSRLFNIRKSRAKYAKHGISLTPTTRVDPTPSIVPRYAHAVEFALVHLRYRYGASIDRILLDEELGAKFEQLAGTMAPGLSPRDLRLGALYLRKTRNLAKKDLPLFESIDAAQIESKLTHVGPLSTIAADDVADEEGLLEVVERNRYLYVARNENLRAVVKEFIDGPTLSAMGNQFWTPDPESIHVHVFVGTQFLSTPMRQWQLKVIEERKPVFNLPITDA